MSTSRDQFLVLLLMAIFVINDIAIDRVIGERFIREFQASMQFAIIHGYFTHLQVFSIDYHSLNINQQKSSNFYLPIIKSFYNNYSYRTYT